MTLFFSVIKNPILFYGENFVQDDNQNLGGFALHPKSNFSKNSLEAMQNNGITFPPNRTSSIKIWRKCNVAYLRFIRIAFPPKYFWSKCYVAYFAFHPFFFFLDELQLENIQKIGFAIHQKQLSIT